MNPFVVPVALVLPTSARRAGRRSAPPSTPTASSPRPHPVRPRWSPAPTSRSASCSPRYLGGPGCPGTLGPRGARRAGAARPTVGGRARRARRRAVHPTAGPDDEEAYPFDDDELDLADCPRRGRPRAAAGPAVPGGVRRALPRLRREPQRAAPCACEPEVDPRWADTRRAPRCLDQAVGAAPYRSPERTRGAMAVPKRKTSKAKTRSRRAANWRLEPPARSVCPQCAQREAAARGVPELRLVQGPRRRRGRLSDLPGAAGARRARRDGRGQGPRRDRRRGARARSTSSASPWCSSGRPSSSATRGASPLVPCTEVIAMDEDPAPGRPAEEGLLARARRRARPRRDGRGDGLGRQHRRDDGRRAAADGPHHGRRAPGIATPLPAAGIARPTVLVDAGANAECQPEWLVQFAQMGGAYLPARYGVADPSVGLLSIGEEPTKGNALVKETHELLATPRAASSSRQRRGPRPASARRSTSSSPTASPATSRSRPSRAPLRFMFDTIAVGDRDSTRRPRPPATCSGPPAADRRDIDPETTAGRCCSASTASASSATAPRRRRAIKNALRVAPRPRRRRRRRTRCAQRGSRTPSRCPPDGAGASR